MKNAAKTRLLRPGDLLAMLAVLLLALALLLSLLGLFDRGREAEILIDGEPYMTLPLSLDRRETVTSRGVTLVIVVEDGAVFVESADCDDLVCQHTGSISRSGTAVVCAPAGVVIRIVGGGDRDADFIAG